MNFENLFSKLLTFWIPSSALRKKLRGKIKNYLEVCYIKKNHQNVFKKLKLKIKNKEKINVAFLVRLKGHFPAENVFVNMLNSDIFNPYIVVVPDISLNHKEMIDGMEASYNLFIQKYKNVFIAYDKKTGDFIDFIKDCDIAYFDSPYDGGVHELYKIKRYSEKCITFFVPYSFFVTSYIEFFVKKVENLRLFWKIFIETEYNVKYYKKENLNNIKVIGYPRIDSLAMTKVDTKRKRKKVIIATHSVSTKNNNGIEFAQFLNFYNVFLELPKKYPEIDFVFRPHPLQYIYLKNDGIWTDTEIKNYIDTLKSYPNLIYQDEGDFTYDFVNSDGIIHDCGSFLPEYLITGHPTCYLMDKKEIYEKYFTDLGKKCLDNCYIADCEQKIYNFIDNVIINEKDSLKEKRLLFINKSLKTNYGNASNKIIDYIKKKLKN